MIRKVGNQIACMDDWLDMLAATHESQNLNHAFDIYVAVPYTDKRKLVRRERFKFASLYSAEVKTRKLSPFSPITHSHPMSVKNRLPTDWEFWADTDKRVIVQCTTVHVLCIPGWTKSKGVTAEIEYAKQLNKPIHLIGYEILINLY